MLLVLLMLVLCLLGLLNLARVSVWAANHFLPAWQFGASGVELSPKGSLSVRGLSVRLREDGSEVLSLKKGRIAFSWMQLRQHRLNAVDLDGIRVAANDAAISEARKLIPAERSSDAGWKIDRLTVRDGHGDVALAKQQGISARVDAEILSLGTANPGGKADSLRLRELVLHSPTKREIVSVPEASLAFAVAELKEGHVRRIVVDGPQVSLTQEETALVPPSDAAPRAAIPWRIDELAISKGNVRVDIPTLPRIEGEVAIHAANLGSAPSETQTPGELRVEKLSLRPRDEGATPASLTSATVQFTGAELMAGHLREVRLDGAAVTMNEAWKDVLSKLGNGDSSAPSAFPLKIDHLVLEGGKANITLPGIPAILGTLAAEFKNIGKSDSATQRIEFHDLHIGLPDQPAGSFHEWLTLPKVRVSFNVQDLVERHRVQSVDIDGATLRFDRETRAMFAKVGNGAPSPAKPFISDEVHFRSTRVALDDLGLGMPPLDFLLNVDLSEVPLNDPLSGDTREIQALELSNINFVSPLDPFVPVLTLRSVFIRWTPLGLRDRQIDDVTIVGPEINIGPDLFWYLDLVDKRRAASEAAAPAAAPGRSWRLKRFEATSGKLILALAGQARITLPMPFESHAENVDFQRLSDAKLRLILEVPSQDYENRELDLHLHGVSGKIDFQIPPGTRSENVVQTLKVRDMRWKNFRGADWWLGLTFDQDGVHGDGGGKICSGDIRAGFTYFLDPRAPWTGWVGGTRLDLKEITDKLATGRASMTGRANVNVSVNGVGGDVSRVAGDFRAPTGGKLRITKLDDLISAIPADWEITKRDLMRIGIETLRDFTYESGKASFWLTEPVGQLNVRLDGSLGRRELEVNFNPPGNLNRLFLFSPFKP